VDRAAADAFGVMRIAILDLQRTAEFFGTDRHGGALRQRLEAAGHKVDILREVQDAAGLAWRDQVADFVRAGAFDAVVLLRAWEPGLVASVRGAMRSDAALVRLASVGAAGIDDRFDHVLSEDALVALFAGIGDHAAATWRPIAKAELRGRTAEPGLPDSAGSRPTIRGPATGCPFLLDARKQPAFAELGLDPARIQTRGCTFCLDQIGTFVAPKADEVLAAWLGQLRALRKNRPDFREVLLADERPHPYLPGLFQALIDEPGLGPVDLMFKSRVDWLLEFADTALAEACVLAEKSASTVYPYLVGFENFAQNHLDLFNKGVTVADNFAALAKLRELAERFPRSFVFDRYRCHGLVLFTPWTMPADLLENAKQMRALRFDKVRDDALKTRLRLYPHVPLHALAERDGLLADTFAVPDRAEEQGYDASLPWRFREPATEAVFHAANALHDRHGIPAADALELAVQFVMRYRQLSQCPPRVPALIQLPLRDWGRTGARELVRFGAATVACTDRELDGVLAGRKRACLKEQVPAGDVADVVAACEALGLHAAAVHGHGLGRGDAHTDGTTHALVAVAAAAGDLARLVDLQRRLDSRRDRQAMLELGELLGYPRCCSEAHADRLDAGDNLGNERTPFAAAPAAVVMPECQRLGEVALVSHHLCRPDCAASAKLAHDEWERLRALHARGADWLLARLRAPILFLDHTTRLELDGAWQGERFLVNGARWLDPVALVSADAIVWIGLLPDAVTFDLRDGRTLRVPTRAPLLVVPGEPLAPPAAAALAGSVGAPDLPPVRDRSHAGRAGVDLAALQRACTGASTLVNGWRIADVMASRRRSGGLDVVLERDGGGQVTAFVAGRHDGDAWFVAGERVALSYFPPEVALPADELRGVLEALRDRVEAHL
jgi:hypothetical protein